MPTIALFYGIIIEMYWADHNPPHFHARYGGARALIRISDGEIIAGELPSGAKRIVKSWASLRRAELQHNWLLMQSQQCFERIAGPDGQG